MWFFAILVVIALGGVALVAAGHGSPLAETYDDRPDVAVPAGRALTGADLRRIRFGVVLRGYRMAEVDALLDRLAGQLDKGTLTSETPEAGARPDTLGGEPGR